MKRFKPLAHPTECPMPDAQPLDTSLTRRTMLQASALATAAGMVLGLLVSLALARKPAAAPAEPVAAA